MKIWIFGGSGTLGRHVWDVARERGYELIVPTHHACEIEDIEDVRMNFASGFKPDVIINCAGQLPGSSPQSMLNANAIGPWNLASQGIRMVHMSTDAVFSGQDIRNDQYQPKLRSDDLPDPCDIYGRSKLAGEVLADHVLNVRGSFIDLRSGFLHWVHTLLPGGQSGKAIEAWMHVYWNGTSAKCMAYKLMELAEGDRTGVVHTGSVTHVSKAWMIEYLVEALGLNSSIQLVREPQIWHVLEPDDETLEFLPVKEILDELIQEIKEKKKAQCLE